MSRYTDSQGHTVTNCPACPGGSVSPTRNPTSSSQCSRCGFGNYKLPGNNFCQNCPTGTNTTTLDSTSKSQCKVCSSGFYRFQAGRNFRKCVDKSNWKSCSAKTCWRGKYNSDQNIFCSSCPQGKSTLLENRTSADQCTVRASGYYYTGKANIVVNKLLSNFVPECTRCPTGRTSFGGSTTPNQCNRCAPGFFGNLPAGKFYGDTSRTECVSCSRPRFSVGNSTSSSNCTETKFPATSRCVSNVETAQPAGDSSLANCMAVCGDGCAGISYSGSYTQSSGYRQFTTPRCYSCRKWQTFSTSRYYSAYKKKLKSDDGDQRV